jgi:hypothetical protein
MPRIPSIASASSRPTAPTAPSIKSGSTRSGATIGGRARPVASVTPAHGARQSMALAPSITGGWSSSRTESAPSASGHPGARSASTSVIGNAAWRHAAACGSRGSEPGHERGHNAQRPAGAEATPSARDDWGRPARTVCRALGAGGRPPAEARFAPESGRRADIRGRRKSAKHQTNQAAAALGSLVRRLGERVPDDLVIIARQLHRPKLEGDLRDLASKAERHLVVVVVHARAVSTPTSKVSSIAKRNGTVCGTFLLATSRSSTFRMPVRSCRTRDHRM